MSELQLLKKEIREVRKRLRKWPKEKLAAYRYAISSGAYKLKGPQ